MKKCILTVFLIFTFFKINAQLLNEKETFTRADTLRGALRPERICFDILRYDINIKVEPKDRFIAGYNDITFKITENTKKIQLDLFKNMQIDSILYNGENLNYNREFNAVFISFSEFLIKGKEEKIRFYYSGYPIVAENAPWDGGFVFSKDTTGKDWIAVAVQGIGASLWIPVKDYQGDEPDNGVTIKVAVPNGLMNVSNGRFTGSEDLKNGTTRWDWEVKNPINAYNITLNIADYAHFNENYKGLDLDYYVLKENLEKAKVHFEEVKPMMDCFQSKFGKYPFGEDGYKMVETPYLGMEHQSAIAYGNQYKKGYLGKDRSDTGVGLLFDFITIHESGHEWFGNSLTARDIADMWIHEAFTTYTETVFTECQFGYDKALAYINGHKNNIRNDSPIIGVYNVNKEGSGDMYYKGALLLNTLRNVINNDKEWWKLLLDYSETYRHQIIDTETVIQFFNERTKTDLTPIFDQYLRYKNIPVLELRQKKKKLEYRWKTDVNSFQMPVEIIYKNQEIRLKAINNWKDIDFNMKSLDDVCVRQDKFYINVKKQN